MSKLMFWIGMFFLTVHGQKEYYTMGQLKSILFKTSRTRMLLWLILGLILWKVGVS